MSIEELTSGTIQRCGALMQTEMQYEVGDMVYIRNAIHDRAHRPKQFVILERYIQQCMGGIQLAYRLNARGEGLHFYMEVELTLTEPKYQKTSQEELEDCQVTVQAQSQYGSKNWKDFAETMRSKDDTTSIDDIPEPGTGDR